MLKKPTVRLGRVLLLLALAYGGFTAIVLIAGLVMYSLPPIHAITWHLRHGNNVSFDGHRFHLPSLWYPVPDDRPSGLTLQEAHFGSVDVNNISLTTNAQNMDDELAQKQIARIAALLNERSQIPHEWASETLRGKSLTYHCAMASDNGKAQTLLCHAGDSNLTVEVFATGRARTDALNILETSE